MVDTSKNLRFQELNYRYHRYVETSVEVGVLVKEFEAKYLKHVEEAYSSAVKLYATYKKALKLSVKKAKVKLLEAKILNLKEAKRAEIEAATEVVETLDKNVKKV